MGACSVDVVCSYLLLFFGFVCWMMLGLLLRLCWLEMFCLVL